MRFIEQQLTEAGNDESVVASALQLYLQGGNVASYATLQLTRALPDDVENEQRVIGRDTMDRRIEGRTVGATEKGSQTLQVRYLVSADKDNYLLCRVGALNLADAAVTEGCECFTGLCIPTRLRPCLYNSIDMLLNTCPCPSCPSDLRPLVVSLNFASRFCYHRVGRGNRIG